MPALKVLDVVEAEKIKTENNIEKLKSPLRGRTKNGKEG